MSKRFLGLLALSAVVFTTGCATKIKDIAAYREAPMSEVEVMPTPEQLQGKRVKVIVFETDDNAVKNRLPGAGLVKTRKIEDTLSGSSVEIVDRNLAVKLRDEVAFAEAKGGSASSYTGPEVASFAIRSFLTDVGAGSSYTPASSYCDKKGKCYTSPHYCRYTGTATGGLRVYEIPSLRLVKSFSLKGSSSTSENDYCRDNNDVMVNMSRQAVEDTVHSSRADLKNMFAPKGYVVEKRVKDSKVIFKVMVGRVLGAQSQDSLTFYTLRKNENRLTKKVEQEEVPIATGVISDQIGDDYAWIVPDDLDKANKIRLGDFVKVVY